MAKKNGLKLLKIAGGVLLMVGGIVSFSKYIIDAYYVGVLVSGIAFFVGLWLIGQVIE